MSKEEKKLNKILQNGLNKMDKMKHEDAIKEFLKAVTINPQFIPAWVNMIKATEKLRHKDKYIETLEVMLKGEPKNKEPWDLLGKLFVSLKDYENIIKSYKKVVELDPRDIQAWNQLTIANEALKNYKDAINCHNKIINIDSKNVESLYNSARIYQDFLKNYKEAIMRYEKVVKIVPNNKEAWYNIADIWFILDEFQKAIENAQKAIDLDPKYNNAWQILTASKDRIEPNGIIFWRKPTWVKLGIISKMNCGQCDKKILESTINDKFEHFTNQEQTNFYFCNTCRTPYHAIPCMEQLKIEDFSLTPSKISLICKKCGSSMAVFDKIANKSLKGVYDIYKKEFINLFGGYKVAMGRSGEHSYLTYNELKNFAEALENKSNEVKALDINSINNTRQDKIKKDLNDKKIKINLSDVKIYKISLKTDEIRIINCGNCHAPLDVSAKTEFYLCSYCNAIHL
ncbi:MAG: tetratricopeptide repeat protein [Candidatus Lokiarchaeota archaeon]|nr:tetratricopeptide repeat protein [Candidatus Lokiarchaeota archaeon]